VGTGLGLWVSKGIVKKHGGSIVVDDTGEEGATFRVRLPAKSEFFE
jgi:signal transduction histidine kinase